MLAKPYGEEVLELTSKPAETFSEAAMAQDDLTEVRDWINAAPDTKERNKRKAVMHGVMYSGNDSNAFLKTARSQYTTIEDKTAADVFNKDFQAKPGDWVLTDKPWDMAGSGTNPKILTGQQKVPVLSVVPPASIIAQATAMRYGAFFAPKTDGTHGYGPYNWRDQPIEAHIYIDAAMRHLMQWWDGEESEIIRDPEGRAIDNVSHLAFALATIGILIDARANDTAIDDRPKVRKQVAGTELSRHKLPRFEK